MDNHFLSGLGNLMMFFLGIFSYILIFYVIYWIYKTYRYLQELTQLVESSQRQNEKMFKLIVKNLELKQSIKEVEQE